jgi:PHD/YefM family antitoxin component YafN of YafNO toxin-antitoxin module
MDSLRIYEENMLSTQHTQSLSDFRQNAGETLDRLANTGEAEIITVNGEARAVLIAPAVYDELAREVELARDVAAMRKAMKEIADGRGVEATTFFAGLRAELLAMKAAEEGSAK